MESPSGQTNHRPVIFGDFRTIILKTAQKWPCLDTKSAIELDGRLETAQNLFVVMRVCCRNVLSYLDAGFEPPCCRKDF